MNTIKMLEELKEQIDRVIYVLKQEEKIREAEKILPAIKRIKDA